jgi:aldose 1-epimerase
MTGSSNKSHELHAGPLRLAVRPDRGGSIAGLWHDTTPLMRSTEPAELATARLSSSFPLVPYSNRLGNRRFGWKGKQYTTAANFGDNPHSVHGVAWMHAWDVVSSNAAELVLGYAHVPDEHWPFAFEVKQRFSLTPEQLTVQFVFTNTADIAQPAGLGWHPYFPKRARSRLHIAVSDRWESDTTQLPTGKVAQPGIDGDVANLDFDHCFEGWAGPAHIRDEKFSLQLTSSLPYLVVYTPHDKDYFCVEPVSHVSNAIQMTDPASHGLLTLEPGKATNAWMKLDVSPL